MRAWAYSCILASLIAGIAGKLLPEKMNPDMAKALRFLASLILVVIVFSPVLQLLSSGGELLGLISPASESQMNCKKEDDILRALCEDALSEIQNKARTSFPKLEFSLEGEIDENYTLKKIFVQISDATQGDRISAFIEKNYGIETEVKTI